MIAEVTWPGSWIEFEDQAAGWEVQTLLLSLTSGLADANLALILFQNSNARSADRHRQAFDRRSGTERAEAIRKIEQEIRDSGEAGGSDQDDPWEVEQRIRTEAERRWKRQRWSSGRLPSGVLDREPFMHARSFVYALDGVWKLLETIARSSIENEGHQAMMEMKDHLPHLVAVRNTAHHHEDRIRGLNRWGKPIELQPVENSLVHAPGGVLMVDNLHGDRYTCTLEDGSTGEVPVNEGTLLIVQHAVQRTLDSFTWSGPQRDFPTDL